MIAVKQIDQAGLATFIQNVATGSAFSGAFLNYVQNSGWLGPLAVTTTGNQNITGIKNFQISPTVPYSGSPNSVPSQLFVTDLVSSLSGSTVGSFLNRGVSNDIVSGNKIFTGAVGVGNPTSTGHAINLGTATGISGQLTSLRVTGSSNIMLANLSGLGGTSVIWSGNNIFISAGGGGGSANVLVTGSSAISTPNFTGKGTVTATYDGTYVIFSGNPFGLGAPNAVFQTGDQNISGQKIFTGNPLIAAPTLPSGATNLLYVSGVSGGLQANLNAAIIGATIYTGTTNNYSITGVTGNFVNMSFYFDEFGLYTGVNVVESLVGRNFFFTGYAIGAINSGTQGFFSGSFYQRNTLSIKTNFINFSLNSGQFFTGVGGYNQVISGMNRVGLDIYQIGTGITGLSVGLFGVGY